MPSIEPEEHYRRRQAQIVADGDVQEAAHAAAYVGQDVLFTYSHSDNVYDYSVFPAKVVEKKPNGMITLMVFSPDGASGAYTLERPYFTTAEPGTPEASTCWSWSPYCPPRRWDAFARRWVEGGPGFKVAQGPAITTVPVGA